MATVVLNGLQLFATEQEEEQVVPLVKRIMIKLVDLFPCTAGADLRSFVSAS